MLQSGSRLSVQFGINPAISTIDINIVYLRRDSWEFVRESDFDWCLIGIACDVDHDYDKIDEFERKVGGDSNELLPTHLMKGKFFPSISMSGYQD
jgi:hypothetical protein